MKNKYFSTFIFCLSFLFSAKSENLTKDVINVIFNDTNFEQYLQNYENLLVYFTASWNAETPERKEIMSKLNQEIDLLRQNENNNFIIMGEIDSKNYNVSHAYDVQKYPSLILIEGSKHMKYKGNFEFESIIEWLNQ